MTEQNNSADPAVNAGSDTTKVERSEGGEFTPAQLRQLNQILSSHGKRGAQAPDVDSLAERLVAKLTEKPQPEPTEIERMQASFRTLEETLKNERNARKLADRQNREKMAMAEITSHLGTKIPPQAIPTAIATLKGLGAIDIGEDGASIKIAETSLNIKDGIDQFLQSSDGAYFLPAPSVSKQSSVNRTPQFATGSNQNPHQQKESATSQLLSFISKGS